MIASHIAAALLMACIFGFNYSVLKLGLNTFDHVLIAGRRFSLCAIPAIFFLKMPRRELKYAVMYGFLFGAGLVLVIFSIKAGLSAGIAAVIVQTGALMTALVGIIFLKEKISAYNVAGLTISIAGLFLISNIKDGTVTYAGLLLALAGALFWTLSNSVIKQSKTDNPLAFVVWSGVIPAIVLFAGYYIVNESNPFAFIYQHLNAEAVFSILYQAYVNSLLGYLIWITLLSKYKLLAAAPTYILVPVFGLFFSYLIHNEPIGTIKIMGSILIVSGVLVNTVKDNDFPIAIGRVIAKFKRITRVNADLR